MEPSKPFSELLRRYNAPLPRYTSYPAVPYWDMDFSSTDWITALESNVDKMDSGWALYIHIPFCETLCTFCGCNNIITRNHKYETDYLELLKTEFQLYLDQCPELSARPLHQIHLGGGSPTFMSAENLENLIAFILDRCTVNKERFEGAIEVDPRRVTHAQLKALRSLGFNRVSIGVQDLDPKVQFLIHRVQPYETVERVVDWVRELGYHSTNLDLIYGLPAQNLKSFKNTIMSTLRLRPERIAIYSLAIVPWIKPAQKLFKAEDLPSATLKYDLYDMARSIYLEAGYREIGIDHFALPSDSLAKAQTQKTLHRNFMGYTDIRSELTVALGVSAISESAYGYHQNQKDLGKYSEDLRERKIPSLRGHVFSSEDLRARAQILSLMTNFETLPLNLGELTDVRSYLSDMFADGLVRREGEKLVVTPSGVAFVRHVCSAFDKYYRSENHQSPKFSSPFQSTLPSNPRSGV